MILPKDADGMANNVDPDRTAPAGPHSSVGSTSDSRAQRSRVDTRSGLILSFLHPLIQEGQFSVSGESMCTEYWLTA